MNEENSQTENVAISKETTEQRNERLKAIGFQPGQSGNPSGRPKGTMKDYLRKKFMEMSEEEKERFLFENKVTGKDQIEFGEGKAKQDLELSGEVKSKIINVDE